MEQQNSKNNQESLEELTFNNMVPVSDLSSKNITYEIRPETIINKEQAKSTTKHKPSGRYRKKLPPQNAKMLLSISASFLFLNLPYYILSTLVSLSMNRADQNMFLVTFTNKKYLILTEVLQLANFSMTGLIFLVLDEFFAYIFTI